MMKDLPNIAVGLVAVGLGAILIVWIIPAQTVPAMFASVPPRFYSDFTSGMLVASGLALALSGMLAKGPRVYAAKASHIAIRFLTALVLLGGAMYLTPLVGFPIAGTVICLITLLLMFENRWPLVAAICICAPLLVWGSFEIVLGRPLP